MKKFVLIAVGAVALAVPAVAEAGGGWLGFREAAAQIRHWGRDSADENGDTITRQKVDLCTRNSDVRVVCWYKEVGYDVDGYDYECGGLVRVIEYRTHYSIAPIRHGQYRFRCF